MTVEPFPVLYHHRTWFRWWWPIAVIMVALSAVTLISSLQRLDDLFWLAVALFLSAGTAVALLAPWNFVLTTVLVDGVGVHVVKWPGVFSSTLRWDQIASVQVVEGEIFRSVWSGARAVENHQVRISRRPVSVDAYTDERGVLVTANDGSPALLYAPGRDPEALAALIRSHCGPR